MNETEPGWELYRTFLEVVRDGSLSGAARRLDLAQPTIGRHIAALEAALGVSLFTRSPRGLNPTAAALDLLPHAQTMAVAAASLRRAASGEAAADHGVVRVTASEMIGCQVLPAILAGFRHLHPSIVLELGLNNRNEDLLRREADIAVRMVRPTQAALVARRVGNTAIRLYAHKTYVARFGMPETLQELAAHRMIGFDRDAHSFRSAGPLAALLSRKTFGFRTDSDMAQFAALAAGIGIGGCQENIAVRMPDLLPVLHKDFAFSLEMWLVMHEDLKATNRVRLLFDFLAAGLADFVRGNLP